MGKANPKYPGLLEFIVKHYIEDKKQPSQIYQEAINLFGYKSNLKAFGTYCSQVKRGLVGASVTGIPNKYSDITPTGERVAYRSGNKPNDNTHMSRAPESKANHIAGSSEEPETTDVDLFVDLIVKNKAIPLIDLCNTLNCAPFRIDEIVEYHRSKGMDVSSQDGFVFMNVDVIPDVERVDTLSDTNEIIFGVASDLHFGSKSCQITALNEFCHIAAKEGVKHILSPGDIFTGTSVYPGHNYDVYALSAEEQEQSCIVNLPTGFEWFMLGGNHDYSFIKRGGGHNPVLAVSNMREDIHYVGFDEADVPILPGVDAKLWHPSGGVPYSISYRLQKGIEQVAYNELSKIMKDIKEKPTVRFVLSGHLHIQMQALFGSIFGCQSGCFEGQTDYLKRKGLFPAIGGYVIKASLGKNGLLKSFEAKFHIFDEVEDDWKRYKHETNGHSKISVPIFKTKK